MMNVGDVLKKMFPLGCEYSVENNVVGGEGRAASGLVEIVGTCGGATLGVDELMALSEKFLRVIRERPGRPILMLVDNNGQKMSLRDELMGLNQHIAHLVRLQDYARRNSHKVVAVVYGNSIAGGFIAFGLCAGLAFALDGANTSVMALPAMSKVTKLPLEYLEELGRTVAVFAPGIRNFFLTGGLRDVWSGDLGECLEKALQESQDSDTRARLGMERGGRPLAWETTRKIVDAE